MLSVSNPGNFLSLPDLDNINSKIEIVQNKYPSLQNAQSLVNDQKTNQNAIKLSKSNINRSQSFQKPRIDESKVINANFSAKKPSLSKLKDEEADSGLCSANEDNLEHYYLNSKNKGHKTIFENELEKTEIELKEKIILDSNETRKFSKRSNETLSKNKPNFRKSLKTNNRLDHNSLISTSTLKLNFKDLNSSSKNSRSLQTLAKTLDLSLQLAINLKCLR